MSDRVKNRRNLFKLVELLNELESVIDEDLYYGNYSKASYFMEKIQNKMEDFKDSMKKLFDNFEFCSKEDMIKDELYVNSIEGKEDSKDISFHG